MKLAFAAMIATAATLPVLAQTATPHIDQREQRQEQRIQQGEQSGSLTNKEAARLEQGQAHIDRMESKAAADGTVTHKERARMRQAERVQSRHIEKQKHDRQHDYNHNGVTDHRR
ncbi:MAG: hypothetical protein KGL40_01945 [Rhodocyclaceae bacterium]|nr:hypothetical protein [Rhodocyclaceae bacterium]